MNRIADDVFHLPLMPRNGVNAYVIGDVLIDAGYSLHGKKVVSALSGHTITAHAITHAHPDHVGGSKTVCDALGIPFWAPKRDAAAAERGQSVAPEGRAKKLVELSGRFPAINVDRRLVEGDEVAGFRVLDVPGHSPGHAAFFRESDRVLVAGDVWFNMNVLTTIPGLRDPLKLPTIDPEENRRSMRKLADLEPSIACFGHGPVLHDAAPKLRAYVAKL